LVVSWPADCPSGIDRRGKTFASECPMALPYHLVIVLRRWRQRATSRILAHRLEYRHPSLRTHPTVIWDYSFRDIDAIEVGTGVIVNAYAEIVVYKRTRHSAVEGRLVLGDGVIISVGTNIRASGGTIRIGAGSGIGQHAVLIAANHKIAFHTPYFHMPFDHERTGITIGQNVWVGANAVILPGVAIGDNAVIAAGSVVNRDVPTDEIWGGVPARKLKSIVPDPAVV
jgi:acetyltransferase-like isoleucine patch superfamily enzyme